MDFSSHFSSHQQEPDQTYDDAVALPPLQPGDPATYANPYIYMYEPEDDADDFLAAQQNFSQQQQQAQSPSSQDYFQMDSPDPINDLAAARAVTFLPNDPDVGPAEAVMSSSSGIRYTLPSETTSADVPDPALFGEIDQLAQDRLNVSEPPEIHAFYEYLTDLVNKLTTNHGHLIETDGKAFLASADAIAFFRKIHMAVGLAVLSGAEEPRWFYYLRQTALSYHYPLSLIPWLVAVDKKNSSTRDGVEILGWNTLLFNNTVGISIESRRGRDSLRSTPIWREHNVRMMPDEEIDMLTGENLYKMNKSIHTKWYDYMNVITAPTAQNKTETMKKFLMAFVEMVEFTLAVHEVRLVRCIASSSQLSTPIGIDVYNTLLPVTLSTTIYNLIPYKLYKRDSITANSPTYDQLLSLLNDTTGLVFDVVWQQFLDETTAQRLSARALQHSSPVVESSVKLILDLMNRIAASNNCRVRDSDQFTRIGGIGMPQPAPIKHEIASNLSGWISTYFWRIDTNRYKSKFARVLSGVPSEEFMHAVGVLDHMSSRLWNQSKDFRFTLRESSTNKYVATDKRFSIDDVFGFATSKFNAAEFPDRPLTVEQMLLKAMKTAYRAGETSAPPVPANLAGFVDLIKVYTLITGKLYPVSAVDPLVQLSLSAAAAAAAGVPASPSSQITPGSPEENRMAKILDRMDTVVTQFIARGSLFLFVGANTTEKAMRYMLEVVSEVEPIASQVLMKKRTLSPALQRSWDQIVAKMSQNRRLFRREGVTRLILGEIRRSELLHKHVSDIIKASKGAFSLPEATVMEKFKPVKVTGIAIPTQVSFIRCANAFSTDMHWILASGKYAYKGKGKYDAAKRLRIAIYTGINMLLRRVRFYLQAAEDPDFNKDTEIIRAVKLPDGKMRPEVDQEKELLESLPSTQTSHVAKLIATVDETMRDVPSSPSTPIVAAAQQSSPQPPALLSSLLANRSPLPASPQSPSSFSSSLVRTPPPSSPSNLLTSARRIAVASSSSSARPSVPLPQSPSALQP